MPILRDALHQFRREHNAASGLKHLRPAITVLPEFPFRLPGRRSYSRFKLANRDRATGP
jgi:hypothetical protein